MKDNIEKNNELDKLVHNSNSCIDNKKDFLFKLIDNLKIEILKIQDEDLKSEINFIFKVESISIHDFYIKEISFYKYLVLVNRFLNIKFFNKNEEYEELKNFLNYEIESLFNEIEINISNHIIQFLRADIIKDLKENLQEEFVSEISKSEFFFIDFVDTCLIYKHLKQNDYYFYDKNNEFIQYMKENLSFFKTNIEIEEDVVKLFVKKDKIKDFFSKCFHKFEYSKIEFNDLKKLCFDGYIKSNIEENKEHEISKIEEKENNRQKILFLYNKLCDTYDIDYPLLADYLEEECKIGTYSSIMVSVQKYYIKNLQNLVNFLSELPQKYNNSVVSELREVIALKESLKNSDQIISCILNFPFGKYSKTSINLKQINDELNKNCYGMENVKIKLLEIMNSVKNNEQATLPVICLLGSPGVGKTNLVQHIAKATGREYQKISLNTIDEKQALTGFSRTWASSEAGLIFNALKKAKTMNPVILLDEIDKSENGRHGEIENTLISILDYNENHSFIDSFFKIPIDLSKVQFVCTANSLNKLNKILLDRLTIINVESYSDEDKLQIAKNFLLPKILINNGEKIENNSFTDDNLNYLIKNYTYENGVRSLEKHLDSLIKRKSLNKNLYNIDNHLDIDFIDKTLKNKTFKKVNLEQIKNAGVVNGLYASDIAGGITRIEAITVDGKENVNGFGILGEMTKNSINVLSNFLKANQNKLAISSQLIGKDICYNFKSDASIDGPSAGITLIIAIVSFLKNVKISNKIAMTGTIDLNGNLGAIGGLSSKILGAKKEGIETIFLPKSNLEDILSLDTKITTGINFKYFEHIFEVLKELKLMD